MDGMTIAGVYIESGVRNFMQYARAMIEGLGDGVKPYASPDTDSGRYVAKLIVKETRTVISSTATIGPPLKKQSALMVYPP